MSETNYQTKTVYVIFEIRDGLLEEPYEFNLVVKADVVSYGYSSIEEATADITRKGRVAPTSYVILPVNRRVPEYHYNVEGVK